MKTLLLGGSGQVGFELRRTLSPMGLVVSPTREQLNLMNDRSVDLYLRDVKPDIIVNAAAWTAVDAAETHPDDARRLNAGLPNQLGLYAKENNIRIVHFSSDYVYSGAASDPWQENDPKEPHSVYAQTKLEGDIALETSGADFVIFRTSWVYSSRGNNFMKTMLRLSECKDELSVVADQIGAPTPAYLIAQVAALAIYSRLAAGVYNLAPKGEVSWFGFAMEIFKLAEQFWEKSQLSRHNVRAILTEEYPTPAKRPLNSRMDLTKLEKALNISLPDWQSQLHVVMSEYLER